MKSSLKKISHLVTALAMARGPVALATEPLRLRCLKAAGFYGMVTVQETGRTVVVRVKSGLAMKPNEFLKRIGIQLPEKRHVGYLDFRIPSVDCRGNNSEPYSVHCATKTATVTFTPERLPTQTIRLAEFAFDLATFFGEGDENVSVKVTGKTEIDGEFLVGILHDRFAGSNGPMHEGCRRIEGQDF